MQHQRKRHSVTLTNKWMKCSLIDPKVQSKGLKSKMGWEVLSNLPTQAIVSTLEILEAASTLTALAKVLILLLESKPQRKMQWEKVLWNSFNRACVRRVQPLSNWTTTLLLTEDRRKKTKRNWKQNNINQQVPLIKWKVLQEGVL